LQGDQIPLLVRILSVSDVFDSLASDRPYRARMPYELCLGILRENALGGGLDPALVDCFGRIARDLVPLPPGRSALEVLIDADSGGISPPVDVSRAALAGLGN
jgi:HD-GYP domain-containing protein (c-di-GMP phosphodiesterase class II)